jgi:hypothetical protein
MGLVMSRTAQQIIQEEFLIARSKILELAAVLDRIDRAAREQSDQSLSSLQSTSSQLGLLLKGISILQDPDPHRAQRVQELMSRPYEPEWRKQWTI